MRMWFKNIAKDSDVVISSRVRYARSIDPYKFPHIMNSKEQNQMVSLVEKSIDKDKYHFFKMKDIDSNTQNALMEQHLISKEFIGNESGALVTNEDNSIVVMVNEEDHLRMQSFAAGFNIDQCYEKLNEFVSTLHGITFAKNENYGYITSCPTNVGSGMRVSVILHLPALANLGLVNKILDQAASIGFAVRGLYGENTSGIGNMYQISNQKTLGMTDQDIISNLKAVVTTIVEQERKARQVLLETDEKLEDSIYRAYGILKYARIISMEEALKLLSKVRVGVAMKVIEGLSLEKVQSLMIDIGTSTLKTILKKDYSKEEEDLKRGEYIRKELEAHV